MNGGEWLYRHEIERAGTGRDRVLRLGCTGNKVYAGAFSSMGLPQAAADVLELVCCTPQENAEPQRIRCDQAQRVSYQFDGIPVGVMHGADTVKAWLMKFVWYLKMLHGFDKSL